MLHCRHLVDRLIVLKQANRNADIHASGPHRPLHISCIYQLPWHVKPPLRSSFGIRPARLPQKIYDTPYFVLSFCTPLFAIWEAERKSDSIAVNQSCTSCLFNLRVPGRCDKSFHIIEIRRRTTDRSRLDKELQSAHGNVVWRETINCIPWTRCRKSRPRKL